MCYDSDDGADVWKVRTVRARRPHVCMECDLPIPVGCYHRRISSLYDGEWTTMRVHAECDAVAEFVRLKICEAEGEHGFIPVGGLGEEISNLDDAYGLQPMTVDDGDACVAMGIPVDLDPNDEDVNRGRYSEVCEWLWSLAKAQYASPAAGGA
jgi:hypothetical protein